MKLKRSQRRPEWNREHGTVVHECARARLETFDAMAMGKPVGSISVGTEGLRVTHRYRKGTLLADTPTEFAENVVPMVIRKKCLGTLELETPFAASPEEL